MADRDAASEHSSVLYTPEQRQRRDASVWTLVQGILAPLQFLVFVVSLVLVLRYLSTGAGESVAIASVLLKTFLLYAIMITGSLWEKDVFGEYLFVDMFFWEDVVSMLVMLLHSWYVLAVVFSWYGPVGQSYIALAAYVAYVINAAQFLWKFRLARKGASPASETGRQPAPAAEAAAGGVS
ncbi:MAG: 2-vinyl bacteriochlorophyllide hydratase [Pseudomonadota bacterium]